MLFSMVPSEFSRGCSTRYQVIRPSSVDTIMFFWVIRVVRGIAFTSSACSSTGVSRLETCSNWVLFVHRCTRFHMSHFSDENTTGWSSVTGTWFAENSETSKRKDSFSSNAFSSSSSRFYARSPCWKACFRE